MKSGGETRSLPCHTADMDKPKCNYEVRSCGGMGRGAIWEWSVYRSGRPAALERGEVKGAQTKADLAGHEAVERWKAKAAKKGKK